MPKQPAPLRILNGASSPRPRNPFEYGRELAPGELADRTDEVEQARSAMLEGRKLFIIGPRRYGKTSILRAAELGAIAAGAIVFRYDVSAFPSVDSLTARLAADAALAFAGSTDRVVRVVKDLFGALRPTVSIDVDSGAPTISFGGDRASERSKPIPLLTDVLDGIERAASKHNGSVAVVLDEFQELLGSGGVKAGVKAGMKVEEQIRATVQRHRHVGYVFAGSKTRLLIEMTTTHGRPFFNLGDRRFLGPVPRPDFIALLSKGFADGDIVVLEGALDEILSRAEDVPYTVQLLARACWDTCRAGAAAGEQPLVLTPALVASVHERVAREQDPNFSTAWEKLTLPQRAALRALIYTGGIGLASAEVSRRYHISVSTMQTSLGALKDQEILRDELSGGVTHLRFEDPLFSAWIRFFIQP
ncbi:MAG: hypothetical protein ACR2M1_08075 [Gemmatimonadaceae bacterium]